MTAIGMKARLIQLKNHVAAEGWADGRWHFIDTDALSDGEHIKKSSGKIASVSAILKNPSILKDYTAGQELFRYPICTNLGSITYESAFEHHRYPDDTLDTPYVIKKTATPEQERNHYFGWNYYEKCRLEDAGCFN